MEWMRIKQIIGQMNVTVSIVQALKEVQKIVECIAKFQ